MSIDGYPEQNHQQNHDQADHDAAEAADLADVDLGAASAGTSLEVPAADHKHSAPTGTPSGAANSNTEGSSDSIPRLDHQHKRDVRVAKAGSDVGTRNRLNFIDGTGASVTVADDAGSDEVDITVASTTGFGVYGNGAAGSLSTSGNVTLTEDKTYTTLTVNNTHALSPDGFRIFCSTSCTINSGGFIQRNGTSGTQNNQSIGTLKGGRGGGTGGATNNSGNSGDDAGPSRGGNGGAGGAGNGTSGGLAGGASTPLAWGSADERMVAPMIYGAAYTHPNVGGTSDSAYDTASELQGIQGGAGGGGGGGGGIGGGTGGTGGQGGGVVLIVAKSLVNNGTIRCTGGNGGAGGTNAGGGGGGGGGAILLIYHTKSGSGSQTVTAGTGGSGNGSGSNGSSGSAGSSVELVH